MKIPKNCIGCPDFAENQKDDAIFHYCKKYEDDIDDKIKIKCKKQKDEIKEKITMREAKIKEKIAKREAKERYKSFNYHTCWMCGALIMSGRDCTCHFDSRF